MPSSRKSVASSSSGRFVPSSSSSDSTLPIGGGSRTDPTSVASFVPTLNDLFKPHVDSFNFMIGGGGGGGSGLQNDTDPAGTVSSGKVGSSDLLPGLTQSGLDLAVADMKPIMLDERPEAGFPSMKVWVEKVEIGYPTKAGDDSTDSRLMPSECRELGISYVAPLMVTFNRRVGGGPLEVIKRRMGLVPIMVKSARCHLQHLSRQQMLEKHEEADEMGGTFIVNGIDRLIRLLIVNRRHYPTAVIRPAFGKRGAEYSNLAVQMRCVKPDQSSKTITLHYLHNGGINLRFSYRKQEYFIPVVLLLKALCEVSDREIYDAIVAGQTNNAFLTDRVELMLRAGHVLQFAAPEKAGGTRGKILEYLGKSFRIVMRPEASVSDLEIGKDLLEENLFVHCNAARDQDSSATEATVNQQKFNIMIHMIQKLYALAQGSIKQDNPDCLACQEILLPGHLFLMILKEKLEECLIGIKQTILTDMRLHPTKVQLTKDLYFRKVLDAQKDVGRALHYFLVTGNLISTSGLDLMQVSGYTIVAERLNYFRYLSHFRSVHRGQFFTTMKTTEVRKLLPESFGFFCPAHTPDGSPCGLLNHLTNIATILTHPNPIPMKSTIATLIEIGMLGSGSYPLGSLPQTQYLPVILDGIFVGKISNVDAPLFCNQIRLLKNQHHPSISRYTEIYAIFDTADALYPAITLYTTPQRVIRPVRYLVGGEDAEKFNTWQSANPPVGGGGYAGPGYLEWVGSQEQITMEIAIRPDDFRPSETTHMELSPTSMFSVVASMTPFSDFNQSPRNMYQCVTSDHEVLVRQGWRSITQVKIGEEVMTYDSETGSQQWQSVQGKVDQPTSEKLYRLRSNMMDVVCDAGHRWMVKDGENNKWKFINTSDLINERVSRQLLTIPLVGKNPNTLYTFEDCSSFLSDALRLSPNLNLDWCRFLGTFLGQGRLEESTTILSQKMGPASEYVQAVIERLASAVPTVFAYTTESNGDYRFASRALYEYLLPMTVGPNDFDPQSYASGDAYAARTNKAVSFDDVSSSNNRWLHYDWRLRLSTEQARSVLEGFSVAADGRFHEIQHARGIVGAEEEKKEEMTMPSASPSTPLIHRGQVRGVTNSLPLMHDLCTLALLGECRPELSAVDESSWSLKVSFDGSELQTTLPQPIEYVNPAHDGRLYCLTVPAGNFLTRRRPQWKGQQIVDGDAAWAPFFTGNCQMGKQTMGTPFHSYLHRIDNKVFRIQNPQSPLVRNENYIKYNVDNYPLGTNAVVAVISYTGYDMEDAMIINRSSYNRGFMHGSVYKYKTIDLSDKRVRGEPIHHRFGNVATDVDKLKKQHSRGGHRMEQQQPADSSKKSKKAELVEKHVDADGLPRIGQFLQPGDALYTVQDDIRNSTKSEFYKEVEPGYIEDVRILGDPSQPELQKVGVKIRINRNPVIGDKFASRAGQKGIMSILYPAENMPFTESGLQPDIIINPHAFPSRMTIGMLIESMASKAGALNGRFANGTPFQFSETNRAVDHFGEQLRASGYSYVGSEPMYSGITGQELRADIFVGLVYYQRLRHMVSDKSQVRATGPVNSLTRQPIKGRKVHGGIRFGEMERDALLGHGTSFLLHDRLMNCSDYHTGFVCTKCGSVLSPSPAPLSSAAGSTRGKHTVIVCRNCDTSKTVATIAIPYVFMYLANELAAMNIKITLDVKQ